MSADVTRLGQTEVRRAQQVTVLHAVMACLALLVGIQWLLLSVAVSGFQGARPDILNASTGASGLCFAAACWLLRRVPRRAPPGRAFGPSTESAAARRPTNTREEVP